MKKTYGACLHCMTMVVMQGKMQHPLHLTCCDRCRRPLQPKSEAPKLPERLTFAGLCKKLDPETGRAEINYNATSPGRKKKES